jgi:hypothetical protein
MCFIVRHPAIDPAPSYSDRAKAESVLRQIRSGELTLKQIYPNLEGES